MILLIESDLALWKDREPRGHNSIGRVSAFQAECYGIVPRCPLHFGLVAQLVVQKTLNL